jgi:hypothetical protein
MTGEESSIKRIVYMALVIGALTTLLITIISNHSLFHPLMFNIIVAVLFVLIVIVIGYGIFGQQLRETVKKRTIAKKHQVLAKEYFKKFETLVERCRELMSEDRRDAMLGMLKSLANSNPKYVNILRYSQRFTYAIDVCREAMRKLPVTKDNFLILLGWFESVLNLCNEHLIREPTEEIRKRGMDGIDEHIFEDYERCKVLYDRFLDDYMDFAKETNKTFGETVARVYFEVPKGLRK